MRLRLFNIIPGLQPYIKVICSIETDGPADTISPFRVLPDTCVELFVNYIDQHQTITVNNNNIIAKQPQSFIVSRMSRYIDVQGHSWPGCIAICFFPGAASHFFQIPMNEVSDMMIGLDDLWKNIAKEMEECVDGAVNNDERVLIIQQYLFKQLAMHGESDRTIEHWLWQVNFFKGQLTVAELSRKVNISERQLGRRFKRSIGLSPKEFTRVNRFMHSLTNLKKYPSISLTEVAYESGYYDQAHFIHDYKKYAGLTPGELITSGNIHY